MPGHRGLRRFINNLLRLFIDRILRADAVVCVCALTADTSENVTISKTTIVRGLFMVLFTLDIVKGFSMRTETLSLQPIAGFN